MKSTLLVGFVYWLFFLIGNLYWLVYPLTIDLKSHWVLIPFALIAIPAYLAIQLLIPVYLTKKYFKNIWSIAIGFSFFTFAVMYFYGHFAPGFPWVLPGYVLADNEFTLQGFSVWGIYGQTLFVLLQGNILGVAYYKIRRKQNSWKALGIVAVSMGIFFAFGPDSLRWTRDRYRQHSTRGSRTGVRLTGPPAPWWGCRGQSP